MIRFTFGYPETLQVSGTALLISDQFTLGLAFCTLGLLGTFMRFGHEQQAKETREKERLQFNSDLAKAGNFFSKAILEAFSKNGNLNVNARDDGEGYH